MNFGYHPEAEAEYSAAALFYEKRRPGLGADFIDEVERAVEQILDGPKHWPEIEPEIRRCQLHRFPFGLLYLEENDEIKIIAVMHFSRRPGYWRKRLAKFSRKHARVPTSAF